MVAVLLGMNKCGSFPLLSAVIVISVFFHESLNLSCIFDNGYLYIYTESIITIKKYIAFLSFLIHLLNSEVVKNVVPSGIFLV